MRLNGAMVKDARDRKGFRNQAELAAAANISLATISKAENGGNLRPSTGLALCEFLGLDLRDAVIPRHKEPIDAA